MREPVHRRRDPKTFGFSSLDVDPRQLGVPGELFGVEVQPATVRRVLGAVRRVVAVGKSAVVPAVHVHGEKIGSGGLAAELEPDEGQAPTVRAHAVQEVHEPLDTGTAGHPAAPSARESGLVDVPVVGGDEDALAVLSQYMVVVEVGDVLEGDRDEVRIGDRNGPQPACPVDHQMLAVECPVGCLDEHVIGLEEQLLTARGGVRDPHLGPLPFRECPRFCGETAAALGWHQSARGSESRVLMRMLRHRHRAPGRQRSSPKWGSLSCTSSARCPRGPRTSRTASAS